MHTTEHIVTLQAAAKYFSLQLHFSYTLTVCVNNAACLLINVNNNILTA